MKTYGRDSLLILANPILSTLQSLLGLRVGLQSDAQILDRMQKDALEMEKRGYRVVSADEFDLPLVAPVAGRNATYYRVTYELTRETEGATGRTSP